MMKAPLFMQDQGPCASSLLNVARVALITSALTSALTSAIPFVLWVAHPPSAWAQGGETEAQLIERELTHQEARDLDEGVRFLGDRAEVWVLDSLEQGELEVKLCNGARWLFGGRLKQSKGARAIFSALPSLNELTLIFYKAKTKVNPNLEGRYVQTRSPVITARFTLSRAKANLIHVERVMSLLEGLSCVDRAKELLDSFWLSPEVMKEREALARLMRERAVQAPKRKPAQ
jgi:hypothetical protein